jgi:hypothetical protein
MTVNLHQVDLRTKVRVQAPGLKRTSDTYLALFLDSFGQNSKPHKDS